MNTAEYQQHLDKIDSISHQVEHEDPSALVTLESEFWQAIYHFSAQVKKDLPDSTSHPKNGMLLDSILFMNQIRKNVGATQ